MSSHPGSRVVDGSIEDLPTVLAELGSSRVLVLTGPSRRFVERLDQVLGTYPFEVFGEARRHVPSEVVSRASERLKEFRADTLITLGGGAATGLAKALRLEHDVKFVAIPTTYSGSEYTTLFGVTEGRSKRTGRDARVLPDAVVRDVSLTRDMPLGLSVSSLLNALAHPLARLDGGAPGEVPQQVVKQIVDALEVLFVEPRSAGARRSAFVAAEHAARSIESGSVGEHHKLVHALGGALDLEHSVLHSVILPHSARVLREAHPEAFEAFSRLVDCPDIEGMLFDYLTRAGLPTSLAELGVELEALQTRLRDMSESMQTRARDAFHGRRPSRYTRRENWGFSEAVSLQGPELHQARRVVLCIHGRGSTADAILVRARQVLGDDPFVALVAPQAPSNRWYTGRHNESRSRLGGELSEALEGLERVARRILEHVKSNQLVIFGFSQGACLAIELAIELDAPIAGVVAYAGSRIGLAEEGPAVPGTLSGAAVLLGKSQHDSWLTDAELERARREFERAGCRVEVVEAPGDTHDVLALQRISARPLLRGATPQRNTGGFGAFHETEDLPGALPRAQNSPLPAPYGLTPEQVNATGFTVRRRDNARSWLYRVRPSAQQSALTPYEHPTLSHDFEGRAPEVNLTGYHPLALPTAPTDFVDGLCTIGGAGSVSARRGFAVHVYAANRSMEERAFCNADASMLVVPEHGALTLLTEMGVLAVAPGQVAIVPRGLRFSALLPDGAARGYVAEVFGRGFELPERGPAGANGLTDARHFEAPVAWHEDRLSPGYAVVSKLGGKLYRARQDFSPFDVVAWHGNYTPYSYKLAHFSPVSNVRVDHADPSIYTVLSAPLDEPGSNAVDFVVFAPRWDPTEHTFRPPYFHRNATTEFNGIIFHRSRGDFEPGCYFLTPAMTPHGIVSRNLPASQPAHEVTPARPIEDSLWFQFESTLPMSLTRWAESAPNRARHWRAVWGGYRSRFKTDR